MSATITAAELLAKQREVEALQNDRQIAWLAIGDAEKKVEAAKEIWNETRWRAEEAERELREITAAITA